ncbi:RES family NAD+ phosphorylase [Granulosicoccaceae sp. 1_MG-2023]|nr:RES family NAD+ phosphorylase [Granulosicoccaceae sp. 1_MG-2023]
MHSTIWAALDGDIPVTPLNGSLHRLTESQEQVATRQLCDNLAEQSRLEELLEEKSKPPLPEAVRGLDYLLATPWRYPPLQYGSRFGSPTEASLFYGARSLDTCLAESAYYRLVLWFDMHEPPAAPLRSRHSAFQARYKTSRGLRLQNPPFSAFHDTLTHPSEYTATQQLGAAMRGFGIEAFEFCSARDPQGGINVALFTPAALASRKVTGKTEWQCETTGAGVVFAYMGVPAKVLSFKAESFFHDGRFPRPA